MLFEAERDALKLLKDEASIFPTSIQPSLLSGGEDVDPCGDFQSDKISSALSKSIKSPPLSNQARMRLIAVLSSRVRNISILYDILKPRVEESLVDETDVNFSSNSLFESIIQLFANADVILNGSDLLSLAILMNRVSEPLEYVRDDITPEKIAAKHEEEENKGFKSYPIPVVRMSKTSLRYLCDVLSCDQCSKAVYENIIKVISRLAKSPTTAAVLTEQTLEVFSELVADSVLKLKNLTATIDELLANDRIEKNEKSSSSTRKFLLNKIPVGSIGSRQHERLHRSLITLDSISTKTKQSLTDITPQDTMKLWTALENVMGRLKLFLADEEDHDEAKTKSQLVNNRPFSSLTSLLSRLLPVLEAFFVIHSRDVILTDPLNPNRVTTVITAADLLEGNRQSNTQQTIETPAPIPSSTVDSQVSKSSLQSTPQSNVPGVRYRATPAYASYNLTLQLSDANPNAFSSILSSNSVDDGGITFSGLYTINL
jgi:hypothetical protein